MNGKRETGHEPVRATQLACLDWDQLNWTKIKQQVEKTQEKIFRDTQAGRFWKAMQLQKLLVRSLPARLLAVHLVTEVNTGRYTPGIDGRVYRTKKGKVDLVESLRFKGYKPSPVKVTWIPKPDGSKRRLGIPTMRDKAMQMLVLMAMEPEWEARFEPHSFGFRKGRSPIDAVHHIFTTLLHQKGKKVHPGWVFDADITKCFDNISHDALLQKLHGSPFQAVIRRWLKSGAVGKVGFETTSKGTPQGGVISPLLANIALHGMELMFGIYTKSGNYLSPYRRGKNNRHIAFFRYADDFIILAPSREILENYVVPKIKTFLGDIGLDLNQGKTRIVNVTSGFEFLGFKFQRCLRKDGSIKELNFTPSRARLDRFLETTKEFITRNWNSDVKDIIRGLNAKIVGFCNYFKWSKANRSFAYLSHRLWEQLRNWARKRHPTRGKKWFIARYWKSIGGNNWAFTWEGMTLIEPYTRYDKDWYKRPKLRIHASPYDPSMKEYWSKRKKRPRNVIRPALPRSLRESMAT